MKNLSRNSVLLCLLFCIVVVLQFQIAVQQGGAGHRSVQEEPEYPGLQKYVRDTISQLKRSHKSSWEKVKSVIHDLQMNFRGAKEDQSDGKKAAEMSFHKSKETVKESAKSAAEMVGDAVHKTAEKVPTSKSAPASERESDSEL